MLYLQIKKSKIFPYLLVFCNFLSVYGAQLPETEEIIIQENSEEALPSQPLNLDTIDTTELDQKYSDIDEFFNDHGLLQLDMLDEKTLGIDSLDVALKKDNNHPWNLEFFSLLKSDFKDFIRGHRRASKKHLSASLNNIIFSQQCFTRLIEESGKDKKKSVLERMEEITKISMYSTELTQQQAVLFSKLDLQRKEVETYALDTNLKKMKHIVEHVADIHGSVLEKNKRDFDFEIEKKARIFAYNKKDADSVADHVDKVKRQEEARKNEEHKNKMSQLRDKQETEHQNVLKKIEREKEQQKKEFEEELRKENVQHEKHKNEMLRLKEKQEFEHQRFLQKIRQSKEQQKKQLEIERKIQEEEEFNDLVQKQINQLIQHPKAFEARKKKEKLERRREEEKERQELEKLDQKLRILKAREQRLREERMREERLREEKKRPWWLYLNSY